MFEIEKKFKLTEGLESRLLEHGGTYIKEVHFTDTYYDSASHVLTSNDYWLRRRERTDVQWELKVPLLSKGKQGPVKVDKYKEISNEADIVANLSTNPGVDSKTLEGKTTVSEAIEALGVRPIAKFETFRTKYKLPGGFNIDLDKTNFGYNLGEIELLCQSNDEVDETTARILDIAEKLGVKVSDSVTGKVGTYLKTNDKQHYDLLISAGVLVAEDDQQ